MRGYLVGAATVVVGIAIAAAHGCTAGDIQSGAGGSAMCQPCLKDADCGDGSLCGQFQGDAYCAPDCTDPNSPACDPDRHCAAVKTAQGQQVALCVPIANVCGMGKAASSSSHGATTSTGKGATTSTGSNTTATGATTTSTGAGGGGPSGIGPQGGTLAALNFAIVGDTRPPSDGDTAGYPTSIITQIWQDVQSFNPTPAFAVSTGDYMFARPYSKQDSVDQLNLYLGARAAFVNQLFPAMGNHECTGSVDSNCGNGNADGITDNYSNFLTMMLKPISATPYYSVEIDDKNGKWTSKFVFIAANAWDSTQSAWLDNALSKQTTYTFVVRHESTVANQAPGVDPSDQIVSNHPYTVMLCGHTHTYEWKSYQRELVIGNGGAPLTNQVNYGYFVAQQRADGAIAFKEYDYDTNASQLSFAINADGSPAN